MKNGACLKCSSKDIAENLAVADKCDLTTGAAYPQSIMVQTTPQNVFIKGTEKFETRAWICCECGFIEYYLDKPEWFERAHHKYLKNKK